MFTSFKILYVTALYPSILHSRPYFNKCTNMCICEYIFLNDRYCIVSSEFISVFCWYRCSSQHQIQFFKQPVDKLYSRINKVISVKQHVCEASMAAARNHQVPLQSHCHTCSICPKSSRNMFQSLQCFGLVFSNNLAIIFFSQMC